MKKDTKTDSQSGQELELENRKLNNLQMAAGMRAQEFHMACDKIEHARRNVEVISRVYNSFTEGQDIQAKMKEVLLSNLEMLKETSKL